MVVETLKCAWRILKSSSREMSVTGGSGVSDEI